MLLADSDSTSVPGASRRAGSVLLLLAICLIVVVRLALVSSRGLQAVAGAVYDDELFLQMAENILAGDWLGPYHERTLAKGPLYSLFVAANYLIGTPLVLAQQALYLGAGLVMMRAFAPLVRSRLILVLFFAVYAFNPATVGGAAQRATRDGVYAILTVLVLGGLVGLLRSVADRRSGFGWAGLLGAAFAAFWLTREEGIWLVPSAGALVIAILWVPLSRARQDKAELRHAVSLVLAGGIALGLIGGVAAINNTRYGVFLTNEFREGPFPAAYGALSRVEHPAWKQWVPVPKDVRALVYDESPSFRELQPFLEGQLGAAWGEHGCQDRPSTCGEIAAGWFMWALRDAAAKAGYYSTAVEAAEYWQRVASEVNQACREGRLACGAERASMDPPLRVEYLAQLPSTLLRAVEFFTSFAGMPADPQPSVGALSRLPFFEAITRNRLTPAAKPTSYTVKGWAYRPGTELTFKIDEGRGGSPVGSIEELPSPDLAAHFGDQSASSSRFVARCGQPCTISFFAGGSLVGKLNVLDRVPVLRSQDEALVVYVESDEMASLPTASPFPVGEAIDREKGRVLARILDAYRLAGPIASGVGLLAYLVAAIMVPVKRRASLLFLTNTALLIAISARIVLLSVLDITSFGGINVLYLAPAYPLLLAFVPLSVFEAGRVVGGTLGSRVRRADGAPAPDPSPSGSGGN